MRQSEKGGRVKKRTARGRPPTNDPRPVVLSPSTLRRLPLPQPDADGDKEERGRVLIVGGAPEMPGAVILAATAALRAGAGKLQIATVRSIAPLVAANVPEARVFFLPETRSGCIAASAAKEIAALAAEVQAVLIGPGMIDEAAVTRLMKSLLPRIEPDSSVIILDAAAMACLAEDSKLLHRLRGRTIITPHAGEMASILGISKDVVTREALRVARQSAIDLGAVVALKGRETFIAAPAGETFCNRAGNVGLATSGSGDTLSGIIAGLAARGADPLRAAVWGVHLHARAGDCLARRIGPLGFLARELLAEVPALMSKLSGRGKR
ncbi:MAG: NAD(P)H-hydrate dehydratase [Acidobacteriota bacterium]|nr:NAD(P)H-hydrate dehydratase [Acidobacteriota bacterium]